MHKRKKVDQIHQLFFFLYNIAFPSGSFLRRLSPSFCRSSSSLGLTQTKTNKHFLDDPNVRHTQKYEATVSLVGKYIYMYIYITMNTISHNQQWMKHRNKIGLLLLPLIQSIREFRVIRSPVQERSREITVLVIQERQVGQRWTRGPTKGRKKIKKRKNWK
jgi:hypothetical protein